MTDKPFYLIDVSINTAPYLVELANNHEDWSLFTDRQKNISCQKETESIPLRHYVPIAGVKTIDNISSVDTHLLSRYPVSLSFLMKFIHRYPGFIGRVAWVKIIPAGKVYEHCDWGDYYKSSDRFHFVVQGSYKMYVRTPDGVVHEQVMKEGETWWFNNDLPHWVDNLENRDRITMIFDMFHTTFHWWKS